MRRFGIALIVGVFALIASVEGAGTEQKSRPTPTATTPPILKAAGSCLSYIPGKSLVLAEVGTTGRVFGIDSSTRIETSVRAGARLRILYVDGPGGPIAREILPGPAVAKPTPGSGRN